MSQNLKHRVRHETTLKVLHKFSNVKSLRQQVTRELWFFHSFKDFNTLHKIQAKK